MKIIVAGDFYPSDRLRSVITGGEYGDCFRDVSSIVQAVDYAIVNLESPVTLGQYSPIEKYGPNLQSPKESIEIVKRIGFNMVTLANNHIMDYGEVGLNDTLDTCREYGIDTVGAGKDLATAGKTFIRQIGKSRFAFVNCCEHEFSIASKNSAGANPLNPVTQYYQITEAKKNADYVIVIVHGGHEHFQLPSPRMVETYRFFVDCGADVVINHHQHCCSGYETYRDRPIFYGIGNFWFEKPGVADDPWNRGFLVELDFKDSKVSYALHPYIQCSGDTKVRLIEDFSEFNASISRLNVLISSPEMLKEAVDDYYGRCSQRCMMMLEPYRSRLAKALLKRGLIPSIVRERRKQIQNNVNCESHRDILLHMLKHL